MTSISGELPETFTYKGKEYTPKSFAASLGINRNDYVMLTSFSHKPFYEEFEVEIPDNWEHAKMYNLPLDEMMAATDYALNNGFTVAWDGDVSERGFAYTHWSCHQSRSGKNRRFKRNRLRTLAKDERKGPFGWRFSNLNVPIRKSM